MKLIESILADVPAITAIRRDIHAHPELCFQEERTAEVVAQALQSWGIEVHRGLGTTGVVGTIRHGSSPRSIGLRADMDALPMTEHNRFPHASVHPGKMHACGHDGHTAMLLAAAKHLSQHRNFDGTVHFVFQPAEEGGGGAREMIKDGLFEKFPVQAMFGMHNWPGMRAGQFAACDGPMMASSNEFHIKIIGKGSHAALPHNGIDPVPVACQMVQAFQTIITRNKRPIDAAVISVTMIHAGEATNVVPDHAVVQGTVRTFTIEMLDMIERRMQEISQHTAAAFGATVEFQFKRNYPPTINHKAEVAVLREVMKDVVGEENTLVFEPTMGAEDFSYFLQEVPGAYFVIGNGDGNHRTAGHGLGPCTLHNPNYDFNDELIGPGGSLWVRLVERWLAPR
ncbi:MAG: M20 aminoacylase family protein [Betaproteobacteria bacterium]